MVVDLLDWTELLILAKRSSPQRNRWCSDQWGEALLPILNNSTWSPQVRVSALATGSELALLILLCLRMLDSDWLGGGH